MPVITCIEDLRLLARRRVPRMFYDYADSGAWTERTYRANEADFASILFRQRVMGNLENRSTAVSMAGQPATMPVAIAPVGLTGMQRADGEIHAARAAEKFGIPFTLSMMSICSIEDIASHTKAPFWFQLYMMRDREAMVRMIARCKVAKCSALMVTVDLQVPAQRHKDLKNGMTVPPRPTVGNILNLTSKLSWCWGMARTYRRTFGNLVGHVQSVSNISSLSAWSSEQFDPRLSWQDIDWLRRPWCRRYRCQQPWRSGARPRAVKHPGIAADRRGGAGKHRSMDGWRHPYRSGHSQGVGARRARHLDWPRHGVWPGCHG